MKEINKYIQTLQNKIEGELMNKTENGILDLVVKDSFNQGQYSPSYTIEALAYRIVENKEIAYSTFEKYFINFKLRYKILYGGVEIKNKTMKDLIPAFMNFVGREVYSKSKKLTNHTYSSIEDAKNKYSSSDKVFDKKKFTQLKSEEWFDTSFFGQNVTVNLKPICEELSSIDPKFKYIPTPIKQFNDQLIREFL
tara:strand:- start:95 stop:679 length:585 start_codon:yes stop_codon:yes gene_type:complete